MFMLATYINAISLFFFAPCTLSAFKLAAQNININNFKWKLCFVCMLAIHAYFSFKKCTTQKTFWCMSTQNKIYCC